jgi:hypothetical protein
MQIGELARRSGLAASRIRCYEEQGLLRAIRQANGYLCDKSRNIAMIPCRYHIGFFS